MAAPSESLGFGFAGVWKTPSFAAPIVVDMTGVEFRCLSPGVPGFPAQGRLISDAEVELRFANAPADKAPLVGQLASTGHNVTFPGGTVWVRTDKPAVFIAYIYENSKIEGVKSADEAPPAWSTVGGGTTYTERTTVEPPEGYNWQGPWWIGITEGTDPEGWVYGTTLQNASSSSRRPQDTIRRRLWLRKAVREVDEEEAAAAAAAEKESGDYSDEEDAGAKDSDGQRKPPEAVQRLTGGGGSGSGGGGIRADTAPAMPVVCYENQRWFPMKGFSGKLMPTDRPSWSSADGKVEMVREHLKPPPGHQWAGDWMMATKDGDAESWEYAVDFPAQYHARKGPADFVRRRAWRRNTVRVESQHVGTNAKWQEVTTFENQRWYPIRGWTDGLMATDRPAWSSKNGKEARPKDTLRPPLGYVWADEWQVAVLSNSDRDGWTYAVDFPAQWGQRTSFTVVRRRMWRRYCIVAGVDANDTSSTTDNGLGAAGGPIPDPFAAFGQPSGGPPSHGDDGGVVWTVRKLTLQ